MQGLKFASARLKSDASVSSGNPMKQSLSSHCAYIQDESTASFPPPPCLGQLPSFYLTYQTSCTPYFPTSTPCTISSMNMTRCTSPADRWPLQQGLAGDSLAQP